MIIVAILFSIVGLALNIAAIVNNQQPNAGKTDNNSTKKSGILVAVGMANIAIGMMFIAVHFAL